MVATLALSDASKEFNIIYNTLSNGQRKYKTTIKAIIERLSAY